MQVGDIVRFAQVVEAGDESARFRVVEDRGDRVLVEDVGWTGAIVPTFVYLKAELVVVK